MDSNNCDSLVNAVKGNNTLEVNSINLKGRDYAKLLHTAVENDNPNYKIIKGILEAAKKYKANKHSNKPRIKLIYKIINPRSNDTGSTPLQIILKRSDHKRKIVELFLDNGADLTSRNNTGKCT